VDREEGMPWPSAATDGEVEVEAQVKFTDEAVACIGGRLRALTLLYVSIRVAAGA
jgi:hypothetical protein